MKSLFWEVIPASEIENTIWDTMDDTKIKLNLDKFEEKFSQVKKEPKKKRTRKDICSKKKEKKSFLESERQRLINIVLGKIRLEAVDIADAMEAYNLKILTPELCEVILPILPTEAEIKEISKFNGDVMEELEVCDQFVLIISGIVGFKERIKTILFKYHYSDDYMIFSKEIKRIFKIFKFLKEDDNLKRLFEIMLALGNYMNGGSFRGGAYGFSLNSLTKFADTKTGGFTFIDFIIKFINEEIKEPEVLEVIKKLKKFDKMNYQSVVEGLKQMESKWKDVQALKKILNDNKDQVMEEDKSESFLENFYDDADKKIKEIKTELEKIDNDYTDIVAYFGETVENMPMNKFVEIFRKFTKDMFEANNKYNEAQEKLKKKKK